MNRLVTGMADRAPMTPDNPRADVNRRIVLASRLFVPEVSAGAFRLGALASAEDPDAAMRLEASEVYGAEHLLRLFGASLSCSTSC